MTTAGSKSNAPLTCARCKATFPSTYQACPKCGAARPGESGLGPGSICDGKYEIMSLLGVGGMGEVFKARHVNLHAMRTIKVMKKALVADESFRARFLREARLATQVHHPNVAGVHDFSTLEDGTYYMVSEFIDGVTIRQWATKNGRFPVSLAVEIVSQTLDGLDQCHRRGMLHRDISADNIMIMVDADGRSIAKIIDLGIAKMMDSSGPSGNVTYAATQIGMFIGNPRYSSPEQLGDLPAGEEVDARADLYCLGVVLYEMIAGISPFTSDTPKGYMLKHLTQPPPPFSQTVPGLKLPEGFESVVFRALEKDRNKRYDSARTFLRALRPYREQDMDDSVVAMIPGFDQTTSRTGSAPIVTEERKKEDKEKSAWEQAEQANTIESFRSYMREHPEGRWAPDASRRIHEISVLQRIHQYEQQQELQELDSLANSQTLSTTLLSAARAARDRVSEVSAKEGEDQLWERARGEGTSAAWTEFLASFPNSERRELAVRFHGEASEYERARIQSSNTGWEKYLRDWPTGVHVMAAQAALAEIVEKQSSGEVRAYEEANAKNTLTGWRSFLEKFPSSPHVQDAREAETRLALDRAIRDDRIVSYRDFIESHSDSPLAAEAGEMMEELIAFEGACATDNESGWRHYINRWPEARHSGAARERHSELARRRDAAFEAAVEKSTNDALDAFLAQYPEAATVDAVLRYRAELHAWDRAAEEGKTGWQYFVDNFPDSKRVQVAKKRLARLIAEEATAPTIATNLNDLAPPPPMAEATQMIAIDSVGASAAVMGSDATQMVPMEPLPLTGQEATQMVSLDDMNFLAPAEATQMVSLDSEDLRSSVPEATAYIPVPEATAYIPVPEATAYIPVPEGTAYVPVPEGTTIMPVETPKPAPPPPAPPPEKKSGKGKGGKQQKAPPPLATVVDQETPRTTAPGAVAAPPVAAKPAASTFGLAQAEEGGRKNTMLVGGVIGLVVVVVLILFFVMRKPSTAVTDTTINVTATETAAAPVTGTLVIHALPWANVVSITDSDGKNVLETKDEVTPFSMQLPEGRYTVLLRAPTGSKKDELIAEVHNGETTRLQGVFSPPSAKSYFEAAGWK